MQTYQSCFRQQRSNEPLRLQAVEVARADSEPKAELPEPEPVLEVEEVKPEEPKPEPKARRGRSLHLEHSSRERHSVIAYIYCM